MSRTEQMRLRLSAEEKAQVRANAKRAGMRPAEYVRMRATESAEVRGLRNIVEGHQKAAVREAVANDGPYEIKVEAGISPSETYEQFMERRVGELVGDEAEAELAQVSQARNQAQAEWQERFEVI